jgi:hypothetical protein
VNRFCIERRLTRDRANPICSKQLPHPTLRNQERARPKLAR